MLQLSLEFNFLRVCECFDAERMRRDEELHRREEELAFLATHDPLTGLPNRTLILDRVQRMLDRSVRSQTPVAALFIDLDNFKSINDTLGHGAGDELLCAVAARLEGVVRQADGLGRLGGDEFVVIAEELTLEVGPELVAERLLDALKEPFNLGQEEQARVIVSASVGIAIGDSARAPRTCCATPTSRCTAPSRTARTATRCSSRTCTTACRAGWSSRSTCARRSPTNEFLLVYQPTFDLSDMTPTGVEALIRWQHPTRGLVQPDAFIPLLEETGLINEIGALGAARGVRAGGGLARGRPHDRHRRQRLGPPARRRRRGRRDRARARGRAGSRRRR